MNWLKANKGAVCYSLVIVLILLVAGFAGAAELNDDIPISRFMIQAGVCIGLMLIIAGLGNLYDDYEDEEHDDD
jgi:hypothetical protein